MSFFPTALLVVIAATAAFSDDPSPYRITTKRDNDRVEVKIEKEKTIFAIRSPFGISHATIERTGEGWPDGVLLYLHLKGLESFEATSGKLSLHAAVSSSDGKVRVWKDGKEDAPLDAKSPFWIHVRMIGKDGKPVNAITPKDGHFEVTLPQAFFEGRPKSIAVKWIDFYRN